jgi:RimJ/RimL family protein N-acetyltransferase
MMLTFETARLRLRPRTLDDLEAIVAMDGDEEVRRFIGGPLEAESHRSQVRSNILNGRPMPAWAIEWKERPGFLGQCALNPPQQFGATELSWRLVRASWGQGVASEAVSAMLRHAVDELQIGPVVALIHPDNKASRRVAEKVGLRLTGEIAFIKEVRQLVYRTT